MRHALLRSTKMGHHESSRKGGMTERMCNFIYLGNGCHKTFTLLYHEKDYEAYNISKLV